MRLAIAEDRCLTIREIESDLGIQKTCVLTFLTANLGMTRVCTKFIPKLLKVEQMLRFVVAQANLQMITNDEDMLRKIITSDKSWAHGFIPEQNNSFHS